MQLEASLTHSNETILQTESYYILFISHLIQHPKDLEGAESAANGYLEQCNDEVKQWVYGIKYSDPMPGCPNIGYAKLLLIMLLDK